MTYFEIFVIWILMFLGYRLLIFIRKRGSIFSKPNIKHTPEQFKCLPASECETYRVYSNLARENIQDNSFNFVQSFPKNANESTKISNRFNKGLSSEEKQRIYEFKAMI
jgi:hypothetical protein